MSKIGSVILSVFAAIWGIIGVYAAHASHWILLAPVLLSAWVIVVVQRARFINVRTEAEERRIDRLVMWASAAEGVGIFLAVNVVAWAGRPDLTAASIAAVVGLHFLPLARGFPATRLYVAAAAMLIVAIVGIVFSRPQMVPIVCGSCAIILWVTAASLAFGSKPLARVPS